MCGGSVFPKAFTIAFPSALVAVLLNIYLRDSALAESGPLSKEQVDGLWKIWSGYTTVLGFLIVFRNNQAYTRFWEGATLINQVRGEWFNAVSCLIAFCSKDPARAPMTQEFQHTLVRLASILYCFALQQICDLDDNALEIIKIDTMDSKSVELLSKVNDRCELVIQWMQRLIVHNAENKVLDIAPPILSRAFQELSRGIVKLNDVRKISEIPVPFPYAQMLLTMLIMHWFITPLMSAMSLASPAWAGSMTFVSVASYWSLYYIALEIDQPFGEDRNDLPVREMQKDFNRSLLNLLDMAAQTVPTFTSQDNDLTVANMGSNVHACILGTVPWETQATSRKARLKRGSTVSSGGGHDYGTASAASAATSHPLSRCVLGSMLSTGAFADAHDDEEEEEDHDHPSSARQSERSRPQDSDGTRRVHPVLPDSIEEGGGGNPKAAEVCGDSSNRKHSRSSSGDRSENPGEEQQRKTLESIVQCPPGTVGQNHAASANHSEGSREAGHDRGSGRPNDWSSDRGNDRGSDRGGDRGNDRGNAGNAAEVQSNHSGSKSAKGDAVDSRHFLEVTPTGDRPQKLPPLGSSATGS